MPFNNPARKREYMQKYNPEYYGKNRSDILEYRRGRRKKDNENWKRYYLKKKNEERKEKINLGQIYKSKTVYS